MTKSELGSELIYAIQAMEVLLSAGSGVAEVIRHVADAEYGQVSMLFATLLDRADEAGLSAALREASMQTRDSGLKKVLAVLVLSLEEDIDTVDRLQNIAQTEIRLRKVRMESFIERLGSVSDQFLLVSILLPLIAVILGVISVITENSNFHGTIVSTGVVLSLFVVSACLMCVCILNLKRHEPAI